MARVTVLPALNEQGLASLAYPPDAFPGARDVDSPYGTLRVYEWGPADAGKVLFIHGISTPCLALGRDQDLVKRILDRLSRFRRCGARIGRTGLSCDAFGE